MEKKAPEFEYTIVWDEKCRIIWQRDTEVGPGRGARQVIYGCVRRGHDVRGLEIMEVNEWVCQEKPQEQERKIFFLFFST